MSKNVLTTELLLKALRHIDWTYGYPEDDWFSVSFDWDVNYYLEDGQPRMTFYPVVDGETNTLDGGFRVF